MRVDAVVYFRVVDPVKAIVNVQNYNWAISQVAHTLATRLSRPIANASSNAPLFSCPINSS